MVTKNVTRKEATSPESYYSKDIPLRTKIDPSPIPVSALGLEPPTLAPAPEPPKPKRGSRRIGNRWYEGAEFNRDLPGEGSELTRFVKRRQDVRGA